MTIALISFACMMVGALLGGFLRNRLPDEHLSADARDIVKAAAGLIATMAALALGLLVSSAKDKFDSANASLMGSAASRVNLDRILAQYGPESKATRDQLRHAYIAGIENLWPKNGDIAAGLEAEEMSPEMEKVADLLRKLEPKDESQRILKSSALAVFSDGMKLRWSLISQMHLSVPPILLIVLIFWFTVLFALFGLLTPRNFTVNMVMIVCALTVASALFLILDMSHPFEGVFRVSSGPTENTLRHLGRD